MDDPESTDEEEETGSVLERPVRQQNESEEEHEKDKDDDDEEENEHQEEHQDQVNKNLQLQSNGKSALKSMTSVLTNYLEQFEHHERYPDLTYV